MEPWAEVVARWWVKGVEDGAPKEKLRMNCDGGRMREDVVVGRATIKGVLDNARKSDAMVGCDLMIGEEKKNAKLNFLCQVHKLRESNSSVGRKPLFVGSKNTIPLYISSFPLPILVEALTLPDSRKGWSP